MKNHPGLLGPVSQSERINSLDVIRGMALLGILLMNIVGFGLADAYQDPTISGGSTGWDLKVWFMNSMFFEGTMRGLFTMLFGAGFILLTSRAVQKGGGIAVADIYYRRTLWLLLFGLVHAYLLIWFGEILYPYAVFGLMLFPLRKVKPKYLLIAGVFLLSVDSYQDFNKHRDNVTTKSEGVAVEMLQQQKKTLSTEQQQALEKWDKLKNSKTTPKQVEEENQAIRKGYWSALKYRLDIIKYFQTTMVYEFWVWDILSMMLIGMAFFKWRIFQGDRSTMFYFLMMSAGYTVGLLVNYYESVMLYQSNWDILAMSEAHQTYQLGRLFTTVGHVGLAMLFIRSGALKVLQNALAAVGKMALSNYLMHTIICNIFFIGVGFGMFGRLQRHELYYVVAAIWILQLIYSPIWFKYFRFGPAEWAWRSLTYLKSQPFRK